MRTTGIITCFNHSGYIGAAIESLAPQVDEIIVVDDCSRDDSVDVIRRHAAMYPHLRMIALETNVGPSAAFNRGAEVATGQVLVLQGGDDLSLPGRVERQLALLDDADMVYSLPELIDEDGKPLPDFSGREFFPDLPSPDQDLLPTLFLIGNFICAPSACVTMSAFRAVGPFDEQLELLQDYLLWMKIAAQGAIRFSRTRDVAYRKHAGNLSARQVSFDSPLNRRLAAEFGIARLRALSGFSSEVLWNLLQHVNTQIPLSAPPSDHVMRWLICAQHSSSILRSAAVAHVADGQVTNADLASISDDPRGLLRQLLVTADVDALHHKEELFLTMRAYAGLVEEITLDQ